MAGLFDQRGWKAMRISLVVGQLMVHEIIDLRIKYLRVRQRHSVRAGEAYVDL